MPTSSRSTWQEARRRKDVVLRYLAIDRPTVADVDAAAEEIGFSRRSFYLLIAVFRQTREKSGEAPSMHPTVKRRSSRIAPKIEVIIKAAVDQAGPGASIHQIGNLARTAASREGLTPPHDKTVARRVRALEGPSEHENGLDITIDFSPLLANVGAADEPVVPFVTAALNTVDGNLLALRIETVEPTASSADGLIASVLDHRRNDGPWKEITIRLSIGPERQWHSLRHELVAAGAHVIGRVYRHVPMGKVLRRTHGEALAGVAMRPRIALHELQARAAMIMPATIRELADHLRDVLSVPIEIGIGTAESAGVAADSIKRNLAIITDEQKAD